MLIERAQLSNEMAMKLKTYVRRQREKRKQELEQDAAIARHKREAEARRREQTTNLEGIRDQLIVMERRLSELRAEKHQLFVQLKKVLNEDETRRRARESEFVTPHHFIPASFQSYMHSPAAVYNPPQNQPTVRPSPMYHKLTQIPGPPPPQINPVKPQPQPRIAGVKRPHEEEPHYKPNTAVTYTPSIPRTTAPGTYQVYPYGATPYHHHMAMTSQRPPQRF